MYQNNYIYELYHVLDKKLAYIFQKFKPIIDSNGFDIGVELIFNENNESL